MSITSSKFELAQKCPGSFALPHTVEKFDGQDEGTERHAVDEDAIGRGDVPEEYSARWPGLRWRAEVAFAYDVSSGIARELGQGIRREYNLGPFEVGGTADVVGDGPDALVVIDRKSFDPNVSRPEHNGQLKLLGFMAARAYDRDAVDVAIKHEVRPFEVAQLDALDIDAMAVEVRETFLDVARAKHDARNGLPITLTVGKHCRWCPAFHACPKQKELVAMVEGGAADNQVEMLVPLNDDLGAVAAIELRDKLRMLLKRLDASIYARASQRPIPLPNGMMLGKVQTLGNEKLDGDVVYEVVKARHGQAIADAAVERSASKKRLREALGFALGKGAVSAGERAVLDEVRAKGGAKREMGERIEEFPAHQLNDGARAVLKAVNE